MERCLNGSVWVQPAFGLPCGWVLPAGLVRSEDFAAFLVGLLDLRRFLGPPPALAGLGRVKLSSKVPPIVRVCGDFAKATGKLAKTDALDAQVLAHFAEAVRPPVRLLREADTQELNSPTTRRNQIMTMLVAERNRLGRATGAVRPRIEAHLIWLRQELDDLHQELRGLLRGSPLWREQDDLLRSFPGVGPQVSLTLLAYLPELSMLDRK